MLVVVVAERGVGLVHKAKSYRRFPSVVARPLIIGYYHLHCFVRSMSLVVPQS